MARVLVRLILWPLIMLGAFSLTLIGLACTSAPLEVRDWFAEEAVTDVSSVTHLFVLGAGPMPSAETLMRLHRAAEVYPHSRAASVIVSLPTAGEPEREGVALLREELVLRGIPKEKVSLLADAFSTVDEARGAQRIWGSLARSEPIAIVTSPTHLRRALQIFRDTGFSNVRGIAAAPGMPAAAAGATDWLRYGIWSKLQLEIDLLRESVALGYYYAVTRDPVGRENPRF